MYVTDVHMSNPCLKATSSLDPFSVPISFATCFITVLTDYPTFNFFTSPLWAPKLILFLSVVIQQHPTSGNQVSFQSG